VRKCYETVFEGKFGAVGELPNEEKGRRITSNPLKLLVFVVRYPFPRQGTCRCPWGGVCGAREVKRHLFII